MQQPGGDGGLGESGFMYMHGWVSAVHLKLSLHCLLISYTPMQRAFCFFFLKKEMQVLKKCRLSGPNPDLWNQSLHFNKNLGDLSTRWSLRNAGLNLHRWDQCPAETKVRGRPASFTFAKRHSQSTPWTAWSQNPSHMANLRFFLKLSRGSQPCSH